VTIAELQQAAKADAVRKRKEGSLSRKGFKTHGRDGMVLVVYYPDCKRFAYFLRGRRVNRSDIEGLVT